MKKKDELKNFVKECEEETKNLIKKNNFKNFINFDVKVAKIGKNIGTYKKDSLVDDLSPIFFINDNIEKMFDKNEIYNDLLKKYIIQDTILHECGHMIFDLIKLEKNYIFHDKIVKTIDNLDEDYLKKMLFQEHNYLGNKYKNKNIYFNEFIEENYEEYEYTREEIFAESFFSYVRTKNNDFDYNYDTNFKLEEHQHLNDFFDDNLKNLTKIINDFKKENQTLKMFDDGEKKEKIKIDNNLNLN